MNWRSPRCLLEKKKLGHSCGYRSSALLFLGSTEVMKCVAVIEDLSNSLRSAKCYSRSIPSLIEGSKAQLEIRLKNRQPKSISDIHTCIRVTNLHVHVHLRSQSIELDGMKHVQTLEST